MNHHFTVDVEEYFQVSALEPYVAREQWENLPSRLDYGVRQLLQLLDRSGSKGTFFVLGWIAVRHPELVREIAAAGHEIASHGWSHRRVTQLSPAEFRDAVRRSKAVLEDLVGTRVLGYRAPSFSIVPGREWALDLLVEEGFGYDSSLFPVRRRGYGFPGGARDPYRLELAAGPLWEFPPATARIAGATLPAGGGAYFRLLPYVLVRRALQASARRGAPGTFYIHPWELDPDQPRIAVPLRTRIRHYGALRGTGRRLQRLVEEFRFQPIRTTLAFREDLCPAA